MILAVTYNEEFKANLPSFTRAWFPETTDEMEVNWVTQNDGWLIYEWAESMVVDNESMANIKSYTVRSK